MKRIDFDAVIAEKWDEETPEDEFYEEEWGRVMNESSIFDWNESNQNVLEFVDKELEKFGLEIKIFQEHGGTFTVFCVDKRET